MKNTQESNWCKLNWSNWIPLDSELELYKEHISMGPGFYRIRSSKWRGLIYIGQTGRGLRERTRSLARHTLRSIQDPPWNDPHTAAPILWAYRIENNFDYEVSVAEVKLPYAERQCFEDYLIYSHRKFHNYSTLANFGVAHPLWNKPSNKKANREMKRAHILFPKTSLPGAKTAGQFNSRDWLGLDWSKPLLLSVASPPSDPGIYKITSGVGNVLLYCGESMNLRDRINSHKRNQLFSNANASFCEIFDAQPNQLKEREVDMIGAYYEAFSKCPLYQYSNNRKNQA